MENPNYIVDVTITEFTTPAQAQSAPTPDAVFNLIYTERSWQIITFRKPE